MLVSFEEAVAGAAESIPDRLGLRLANGTNRLPLGLQALDLCRRSLPLGRFREALSLRGERFLAGEIPCPFVLAALQVLLPPRKKAVAGGPEPFPDGLLAAARDRADGLPFGLERL